MWIRVEDMDGQEHLVNTDHLFLILPNKDKNVGATLVPSTTSIPRMIRNPSYLDLKWLTEAKSC